MKTSLVTGGAGFIGSHLCEALLKNGHRVICVDNLSSGKTDNLTEIMNHPEFHFQNIDVNNYAAIAPVFSEQINYVFHYAAVVGVKRTEEHPVSVLNDIDGIKNILKLSQNCNVKKVIFASSSEVYGQPVEIPEREEGHVNAKTPYSVTKLVGEQLMQAYYKAYRLPTTSLRFFNVYGQRQESSPYGFVAGIFIRQALNNEPITIFGDGTQTRDFVYIDDNIKATLATLANPTTDGQVINIGTGKPTTIIDLANEITKIIGKEPNHQFLESRTHEIKHRFPDVAKMIRLLAYRPTTTLQDGLKKTIDWYKENVL